MKAAEEKETGDDMDTMNILMEILQDLHPKIDFENNETLIDDCVLDSFDVATIITDVSEEFDIRITANEIIPENFNSVLAMHKLIERLMD